MQVIFPHCKIYFFTLARQTQHKRLSQSSAPNQGSLDAFLQRPDALTSRIFDFRTLRSSEGCANPLKIRGGVHSCSRSKYLPVFTCAEFSAWLFREASSSVSQNDLNLLLRFAVSNSGISGQIIVGALTILSVSSQRDYYSFLISQVRYICGN